MPASPLEPTAMDAACACAACASAGVEITPRAQLGGAAVICKASRFAMVVVDGGGQRQLVMLFILFALLACALAVRMLAGAEGSDERRRSLRLQLCKLHAVAASDATPKLLGVPAAAARLRLLGVPVATAAVPRAGVGGGSALRRFKGRGAAWVRWTRQRDRK